MATPKVKLQQKQVFFRSNNQQGRVLDKTLASITGQPISGNTSNVHTELKLTIPSSASSTISNCSLVQVNYVVEVSKTD